MNTMTYQETLDYLFAQLPMFTRQGAAAYKANLDNITALCKALENPQDALKCVHLAGTNGKGSTSSFIASILQEAGYKVGLFTSPHLYDFRERIRINGECISEEFVIDFTAQCISLINQVQPSFFELTTAMAFSYFKKEQVDIAIIETGMGGRLDSTNIINPILSVITYIGKDHEQFLGNTLEKIAGEKAGIIKKNVPVIIGQMQSDVEHVFRDKAMQANTQVYYADKIYDVVKLPKVERTIIYLFNRSNGEQLQIESGLAGNYQQHNIKTAALAIDFLKAEDWNINNVDIQNGFKNVVKNTGIKGRFEILKKEPLIVADVAHNIDGIKIVLDQIVQLNKGALKIILGFAADKALDSILNLLPSNAHYFATQAQIPRALPYQELHSLLQANQLNSQACPNINEALHSAFKTTKLEDTILIVGSFFTLAELDRGLL
jgi:dihydrofolate synthase / folylpolyglutamate synthase